MSSVLVFALGKTLTVTLRMAGGMKELARNTGRGKVQLLRKSETEAAALPRKRCKQLHGDGIGYWPMLP